MLKNILLKIQQIYFDESAQGFEKNKHSKESFSNNLLKQNSDHTLLRQRKRGSKNKQISQLGADHFISSSRRFSQKL